MSAAIEIRRDGDEWVIEDGSARIRLTKPGPRIVERLVEKWDRQTDQQEVDQPRGAAPNDSPD